MTTHTSTVRRGLCALAAAATLGLGFAGSASAQQEPGEGGPTYPTSPRIFTVVEPDSENPLDMLQIGGGVLAGLALAGAGMALASRRHHADPHHA